MCIVIQIDLYDMHILYCGGFLSHGEYCTSCRSRPLKHSETHCDFGTLFFRNYPIDHTVIFVTDM